MAWWSYTVNKWRKFKQLTTREQAWLLQAWLLLPVVKMMLWCCGYRRTFAVLQRFMYFGVTNGYDRAAQAELLGRLVNIAANHSLLVLTCLPRSLTLWWLSRRAGLAVEFRIGVRKEGGVFAAHAWVELAGWPVGDPSSGRFSPFAASFAQLERRTL